MKSGKQFLHLSRQPLPFCDDRIGLRVLPIRKRQNSRLLPQEENDLFFLRIHTMIDFFHRNGELRANLQVRQAGLEQIWCA